MTKYDPLYAGFETVDVDIRREMLVFRVTQR